MKIPPAILNTLRSATTDGNLLHLTGPQMAPRLYQRVNEVIEGAGGQWDKKIGAHVFPGDAAEAIAPVLASGHVTTLREVRQASQYFPTPPAIVARLVELAELKPGMEVLEPSAGRGAIAIALVKRGAVVDCIERDAEHAAALEETGVARTVRVADFLAVPPAPKYDCVVMNPPFTKGADIQHVNHALRFLKPGGLLVSVMSRAVTWQAGEAAKFRALAEHRGGSVEAVPDGAFAKAGTDVGTLLVVVPATRREGAQPIVWDTREAAPASEPEHQEPMEILDEIRENLRESMAIFDDLARMLAEPMSKVEATPLPSPRRPGQISFDELLDEAS